MNSSELLKDCKPSHGVEIDIRSNREGLYLAHDPFVSGEPLNTFLDTYNHSLLIVNVKEDGLEDAIYRELAHRKITNYFFLDQADPSIIRRGRLGYRDAAIRFSDYESIETVHSMAEFASWVWIDSFTKHEIDPDLISDFSALGLKTCLVSPELHDLARVPEAESLVEECIRLGLKFDAVCTKYPEKWEALV